MAQYSTEEKTQAAWSLNIKTMITGLFSNVQQDTFHKICYKAYAPGVKNHHENRCVIFVNIKYCIIVLIEDNGIDSHFYEMVETSL